MTVARRAVPAALLVALLPGCSLFDPASRPIADGITVLAKADGWSPSLAAERFGAYFAVLEIAPGQEAAGAAWAEAVPAGLPEASGDPREAGRYGSLDDVDFAEQALVVFSGGQSGACPGWLGDVSVEDGQVLLEERRYTAGDGCTDDYNPYRLVLAVDREKLPAADLLPTEDVVFDGQEVAGLVTAYPAAG